MGFRYFHLGEPDVRQSMVMRWSAEWAEIVDRSDRTECFGKALTQAGWDAFGAVTPEALAEHDDWLYDQMDRADYWVAAYRAVAVAGGAGPRTRSTARST